MYESKSVVKVLVERVESVCGVEGRVGYVWGMLGGALFCIVIIKNRWWD